MSTSNDGAGPAVEEEDPVVEGKNSFTLGVAANEHSAIYPKNQQPKVLGYAPFFSAAQQRQFSKPDLYTAGVFAKHVLYEHDACGTTLSAHQDQSLSVQYCVHFLESTGGGLKQKINRCVGGAP